MFLSRIEVRTRLVQGVSNPFLGTLPIMPQFTDVEADHYIIEGAHGTIAEQTDEAYYDDRSDASDDVEKGRLKFPSNLYGRERELEILRNVYGRLASATCGDERNTFCTIEEEKEEEEEEHSLSENGVSAPIDLYKYNCSRVVFLAGYSGIGKSALVKEFTTQVQCKYQSSNNESPILSTSGKYTEQSNASAPFSATSDALEKLAIDVLSRKYKDENKTETSGDLYSKVISKIAGSDLIGTGTEGNVVLRGTFSKLSHLLGDHETLSQRKRSADRSNPGASLSMNAIKECIHEFLSIICQALEQPMIFFLDDLQWADSPSFEMLAFLLSSTELTKIVFICAYRSNEVDADHAFTKLMDDVTKSRADKYSSKSVETMDLFSLSPRAITNFIADSIKKEDADEVTELAGAVYTKTMGNIFFVKQALEELVRKNILFYDVMCFEWRWVVSKVELANYMSDDVVETVKGKIRELSADAQNLLLVMAYIPNSLGVSLLKVLVNHGESSFDEHTISNLLKEMSDECMLIFSTESKSYIFAHDRIRQASRELAEEKEQDEMLLHISQVMLKFADEGPGMEWCLYVAVDLRNSLPSKNTNSTDLIKLNMRCASVAKSKGSVWKENELLKKALDCLDSSGETWRDYGISLKLYNAVIASDFNLGSYDPAQAAIDRVLKNGKSLDDKLQAYLHQMLCKANQASNYQKGAEEGCKLLNLYGFAIPSTISKLYLVKEEIKLKLALKNRPYSCLVKLPLKEDPIFHLFMEVQKFALWTSNAKLLKIVSWKAIAHACKRGMSKYLPAVVVGLAISTSSKGKVQTSVTLGQVALALSEKTFDNEIRASTSVFAYGLVISQLQSFRSCVEPLLQCHKALKLMGAAPMATIGSMMSYFQCYFAAGLELGPLLESKLILVEEYCRKIHSLGFLTIFQISRQFALNLRTRTENPTEFDGEAFREVEALQNMNDSARKMALRDSSSSRLQLAFVFWDEECMAKMLEILHDYPLTDASIARLHNRLCFTGLAALALSKRKGYEKYSKLGQNCSRYFAHLTKHGSVNAKPAYMFMLAMKDPSRANFQKAVDACAEASMTNLEAMAKERYAAFLMKENDEPLAKDHIKSSYWLYQDWGAHAKALKLSQQHEFLKHSIRAKAGSLTLSTGSSGKSRVPSYAFNTTSKNRSMILVKR